MKLKLTKRCFFLPIGSNVGRTDRHTDHTNEIGKIICDPTNAAAGCQSAKSAKSAGHPAAIHTRYVIIIFDVQTNDICTLIDRFFFVPKLVVKFCRMPAMACSKWYSQCKQSPSMDKRQYSFRIWDQINWMAHNRFKSAISKRTSRQTDRLSAHRMLFRPTFCKTWDKQFRYQPVCPCCYFGAFHYHFIFTSLSHWVLCISIEVGLDSLWNRDIVVDHLFSCYVALISSFVLLLIIQFNGPGFSLVSFFLFCLPVLLLSFRTHFPHSVTHRFQHPFMYIRNIYAYIFKKNAINTIDRKLECEIWMILNGINAWHLDRAYKI